MTSKMGISLSPKTKLISVIEHVTRKNWTCRDEIIRCSQIFQERPRNDKNFLVFYHGYAVVNNDISHK